MTSCDPHVTRCTSATTSGARDRGAIDPVAVIRKTSFLVIGLAAAVVSDLSGIYVYTLYVVLLVVRCNLPPR